MRGSTFSPRRVNARYGAARDTGVHRRAVTEAPLDASRTRQVLTFAPLTSPPWPPSRGQARIPPPREGGEPSFLPTVFRRDHAHARRPATSSEDGPLTSWPADPGSYQAAHGSRQPGLRRWPAVTASEGFGAASWWSSFEL